MVRHACSNGEELLVTCLGDDLNDDLLLEKGEDPGLRRLGVRRRDERGEEPRDQLQGEAFPDAFTSGDKDVGEDLASDTTFGEEASDVTSGEVVRKNIVESGLLSSVMTIGGEPCEL